MFLQKKGRDMLKTFADGSKFFYADM